MSAQESQPKDNVKTARDFVKSGAIWVMVIFIGMLLEGLLRFPTFAGYMVDDAIHHYQHSDLNDLALPLGFIIIYVSFRSVDSSAKCNFESC